jgi:hypothetical protein
MIVRLLSLLFRLPIALSSSHGHCDCVFASLHQQNAPPFFQNFHFSILFLEWALRLGLCRVSAEPSG